MSASTETIQLAVRSPLPLSVTTLASTDASDAPIRNEVILAPVDGGFGAWSFLAAAFLVESIVWGFPNAFGVFLTAYLKDSSYVSQPNAASLLPLVGTLASGLIYALGPMLCPLISRMPSLRRPLTYIGSVLCCASLLGASYAHKIEVLVALQGVVYAIGGSMLYFPCISYMSEWFVARRGLANGVIFAGTAVGGLVLPLVLPGLIRAYGVPKTLRILSIAIAIALAPILPFIRGRLPEARVRGPGARSRARARPWLHDTSFWMLMMVNTLQGFAYFVPIVWLPTFASALNLSDTQASVAVALLNGASVVARLTMGIFSDKFDPWILGLSTLTAASIVTFVLWGVLAHTFAGLVCFGLAYGIIASGWSSLWTGFVRPIAKDDPTLSTTLFGLLMLSRGLGNVLSTPISTSLSRALSPSQVGASAYYTTGFDVEAGRYGRMIVYVGTCFASAAVAAGLGWAIKRRSAQH